MKYFLDAVVIHQKCNDSFEAKMPVVQHFFPCTAQNRTCKTETKFPFFPSVIKICKASSDISRKIHIYLRIDPEKINKNNCSDISPTQTLQVQCWVTLWYFQYLVTWGYVQYLVTCGYFQLSSFFLLLLLFSSLSLLTSPLPPDPPENILGGTF